MNIFSPLRMTQFFEVNIYLFLTWHDERLFANNTSSKMRSPSNPIYVPSRDRDCFWKPTYLLETVNDGELYDTKMIQPVLEINTIEKISKLYMR